MSVSGGSPSVTGASSLAACKDGGEIQLILGPMFSGKTSELVRRVRRYKLYKKCLLISYKVTPDPSPDFWQQLPFLTGFLWVLATLSLLLFSPLRPSIANSPRAGRQSIQQ